MGLKPTTILVVSRLVDTMISRNRIDHAMPRLQCDDRDAIGSREALPLDSDDFLGQDESETDLGQRFLNSVTYLESVIPAEAGIQALEISWTPAPAPDADPGFAGVTSRGTPS